MFNVTNIVVRGSEADLVDGIFQQNTPIQSENTKYRYKMKYNQKFSFKAQNDNLSC